MSASLIDTTEEQQGFNMCWRKVTLSYAQAQVQKLLISLSWTFLPWLVTGLLKDTVRVKERINFCT